MRIKTGILILLVSLCIVFASQSMAAESLAVTPADVALLTGLRTDADSDAEAIIAVRLGALFLHRQDNDSRVLVTNSVGTADILNASELDLGWAPGWDFTVEARRGAFGGEVRYFDIPEWSKSRGAVFVTESMVAYSSPGTGINIGPQTISGSYESMLRSVELNFKWFPMDKLSVLAGPRVLKIDEEMDIYRRFTSGFFPINHKTTAENTLLGGQIGVEGVFFNIGGFSADGWLKAGYYANMIESDAVIIYTTTPVVPASSDDTQEGTFVGDLAVNLNYAVTPRVLLTAGYQLLWIEKAALAPEQVHVHHPMMGTGSTATNSVLYQGIRAGVVFLFDIYGKAPAPEPTPAPVIEPKLEPMSKN